MKIEIIVDAPDFVFMMGKIIRFSQSLEDIPVWKAIPYMAKLWQSNFLDQGAAFDYWAPLGPATNRVREFRGYPPVSPILRQSGDLYRAAVEMPLAVRQKSTSYTGNKVMSMVRSSKNEAELTISGEKASNQFKLSGAQDGGDILFRPGPATWSVPARPFWYIDAFVVQAASEGVSKAVAEIVKRFW